MAVNQNRFTAFGVGDGSVRFRCCRCGAVDVAVRSPSCSLGTLIVRAGEFIQKHGKCRTRGEVVRDNLAAGLMANGEKRVRTGLCEKMRHLSTGSWKSKSIREFAMTVAQRGRRSADV